MENGRYQLHHKVLKRVGDDHVPIRTLQDLDTLYGGHVWGTAVASHFGMTADIAKADNPILTTTGGVASTHYGANVWVQLNMERNVFSIVPKKQFGPRIGWRVITAFPATMLNAPAENGLIPDTSAETFAQVNTMWSTVTTNFDSSETEIRLSGMDDQAILWNDRVVFNGEVHKKGINNFLMRGVGTPAGQYFESIDRICSGFPEASCATDVAGTVIGGTDLNIYNLVRTGGGTWADANILHNADAPRPLTLDLMYDLERAVAVRSGVWDSNDQVWLTGPDTFQAISRLLMGHQLFMDTAFKIDGFNGIKAIPGRETGFRALMFNQKMIITSVDVRNKAGHLSPIYLLNMKYLHLGIVLPTVYQEQGVLQNNELLTQRYGEEGQYKTEFQTICTGFFAHGKLRDIV